jgi:SAM-dependent MidA family methyltransferase
MVDKGFSMMHHWDTIIKPILEWVKPHRIVEIGVYEGALTRKLLEYLHANETEGQADSKLIGIDRKSTRLNSSHTT